jgi:hypothetical protein
MTWPWIVLAALGAYHGLNPAMGWLFAVALGLHRRSAAVVTAALVPIALGHALSVAIVAALVLSLGLAVDPGILRLVAGTILLLWALYHVAYGSRHPARVGMQTGMAGLFLWSFLMASAHGAGLMLAPALLPLCFSSGPASASHPWLMGLAAVSVHSAAMLATIGLIASLVYHWVDVGFLRRFWVNLDQLWTAALAATGVVLIAM